MKVLITGAAGFIGYHLVKKLLYKGYSIVGIDNINPYYDPSLKYDRLKDIGITGKRPFIYGIEHKSVTWKNLKFIRVNLEDLENILFLFSKEKFNKVIHLAAQAGIRYSLENPFAYIGSNIIGTMSILEACRKYPIDQLIFASSSSVYGNSQYAPFSVDQNVDHPISLYAATKKSNELMAYTYSYLYNIMTFGLRFFTVYGPWGRPDMAYYSFTQKILAGEEIDVYNHGKLWRDFTYIDDIINGIHMVIENPVKKISKSKGAPYYLYNIGNSNPVKLTSFIKVLENKLGVKAKLNFKDSQPGDVLKTHADIGPLKKDYGFTTEISLEEGLTRFVEWYRSYSK